jgi:RNase P/RNase MRP subunit POP5
MVKFKSRYVLIEAMFEVEQIRTIDPAKFAFFIKKQVENLFGNVGAGKLNKNLQVKYVNNVTNLMTVRCGKEFVKILLTVLSLINEIEGDKVKMHIIAVSGTIKKIELKAKKFLENWTLNYEKLK